MELSLIDRAWEILGKVLILNGDAFQTAMTLSNSLTLAIVVVLLAGLSLAVGQSIILFLNQVQPIRFFFSLFISAVLFLFEFLFLVLSTWLICLLPGSVPVSLLTLFIILGLAYAPLLFSFLGVLPYFGVPILRLLSIWNLLAMVVGFSAVTNVGRGFAFGYVIVGWAVKELLGSTIGQPIAQLGKTIADRVAGVNLVQGQAELKEVVRSRFSTAPSPLIVASQTADLTTQDNNSLFVTQSNNPLSLQTTSRTRHAGEISVHPDIGNQTSDATNPLSRTAFNLRSMAQPVKLLLGLLALILLFILVGILLRPIRNGIFGWYETLPTFAQLIFDLSWIGVVGVIFAGLLAPFETLGWWAGWFGDEVEPAQTLTTSSDARESLASDGEAISRYVIYLDGVGQSGEAHTPDVEVFLDALAPALPEDMELVRGLMMYSVLNKPLNQDRPLTFLWNLADKMRWQNPMALLGLLVNVRNALIVMVSADQRYGPIYNRGIAQVLYNGLMQRGYQPGSATPITLVGYSGGAQMSVAAAPYLRQALGAPIDAISLGGVMSANNNFFKLEHLYHLVGEKDVVEKIGPLLFGGRWKLFFLSYWNRAKRKGKISLMTTGPVGHQVPGGYMDPDAYLPDGRSNLQQSIDYILQIVTGTLPSSLPQLPTKVSNYTLYQQAAFNQPAYYPLHQTIDTNWYQPIAAWMGRLILPDREDRQAIRGVLFEVHHTAPGYEHLIGHIVKLRWADTPYVKKLVQATKRDVHFSVDAEYSSRYEGLIHPERVNHWQQVGPLESLAGARPVDDMVVMLDEPIEIEEAGTGDRSFVIRHGSLEGSQESGFGVSTQPNVARSQEPEAFVTGHGALVEGQLTTDPGQLTTQMTTDQGQRTSSITLRISSQPVEITGRFYGLVRFVGAVAGTDQFRVVHFNRELRQFNGLQEMVRLPQVVLSEAYGSYPSTTRDLEKSYLNEMGWYIYGAKDGTGQFVVRSLAPRALFCLQPDQVVFGSKAAYRYIRQRSWANIKAQKGRISSVLCTARTSDSPSAIQSAIHEWQEGDRALVLHVYGGIGGKQAEPSAATPIFFGHFSFGEARVIRDPLSDELRFDLRYYQVYTHNTDGLIAGTLHWSRYLGDRQFGWLGNRPVCDILIKQDAFTKAYDFSSGPRSALDYMLQQLEVMTARYRIGDGTGGTYVGVANNCAQDSNQALFASLRQIEQQIYNHQASLRQWGEQKPEQAVQFANLISLKKALQRKLQPLGGPKSSWERNEYNLGSTLEDEPIHNLITGLGSWRTLLPRLASDTVVKVFLDHGASVWVLRTNQIGGYDPNIEPIAPMTL